MADIAVSGPGRTAEDEAATRAHHRHGAPHEGVDKRLEFQPLHCGLVGGVARRPPARLAQLLSSVSTGIRIAATPCLS